MRSAVECLPRRGLANFFRKGGAGGTVRVAYLGGSITAAEGWRVRSLDLFRTLYPRATFEGIPAAIGGTGSDAGVFRLDDDVIRHKPDLLCVEFAANDSGTPPAEIRRNMEGIVRNTWHALPDCDILFVYTLTADGLKALQAGVCGPADEIHEAVADHYGIPSIHLGVEAAKLERARALVMTAPMIRAFAEGRPAGNVRGIHVNPDGRIPFSGDGVHPHLETGHVLYTQAIGRALPAIQAASAVPGPHRDLPVPLDPDVIGEVTCLDVGMVQPGKGWTRELSNGFAFVGGLVPSLWRAAPGAELAFSFQGAGLMLYTLAGPESGCIELTVDGQTMTHTVFDEFSDRWRVRPFIPGIASRLNPAIVHGVRIRVLAQDLDKRAILAKTQRVWFHDADPDAFQKCDLLLGGILIEGAERPPLAASLALLDDGRRLRLTVRNRGAVAASGVLQVRADPEGAARIGEPSAFQFVDVPPGAEHDAELRVEAGEHDGSCLIEARSVGGGVAPAFLVRLRAPCVPVLRIRAAVSPEDVAAVLADQPWQAASRPAGGEAFRWRLAVAPDALLLQVQVRDMRQLCADVPWNSSSVEIFVARAGQPKPTQLCLVPGAGWHGLTATCAATGLAPEPPVAGACAPLAEGGYELQAAVPLGAVKLAGGLQEFQFEMAVNATFPWCGSLGRKLAFGAGCAYASTLGFGRIVVVDRLALDRSGKGNA